MTANNSFTWGAIGIAGIGLGVYALRLRSMSNHLVLQTSTKFDRNKGKIVVTAKADNPTQGAIKIRSPFVVVSWIKSPTEKVVLSTSSVGTETIQIPALGSRSFVTELGFNRQSLLSSAPGLLSTLLAGGKADLEVKTLIPILALGQQIPVEKITIEKLGF